MVAGSDQGMRRELGSTKSICLRSKVSHGPRGSATLSQGRGLGGGQPVVTMSEMPKRQVTASAAVASDLEEDNKSEVHKNSSYIGMREGTSVLKSSVLERRRKGEKILNVCVSR